MILDSRELPDGTRLEADVCIIGAGPAGITVARELADTHARVVMLESGGLDRDDAVERLSEGENAGEHAIQVNSRLRYLGGASNHWGGNCAPYDPIDFAARPHVPHAEWPLSHAELDPWYRQVQTLCGLGEYNYEPDYWAGRDADFGAGYVPLDGGIVTKVFQRNPMRFGVAYRELLAGRDNHIELYLHATALHLEADASGQRIRTVRAGCLDGRRFVVEAKVFVLAAAIENARLLLLSNDVIPAGLGNEHDNVGRYFMGHLNFFAGVIMPKRRCRDLSLYSVHIDMDESAGEHKRLVTAFQPAEQHQRRQGMLNYAAFVARLAHVPAEGHDLFWQHADQVLGRIRRRSRFARAYAIRNWIEQAPRPENRLALGEGRDAFGLPRIRMHWRVGELEKHTLRRAHDLLDSAFRRGGVGRLYSDLPPPTASWPADYAFSSHAMGTTRMSATPRTGVVDSDCRVHGMANLYVAGGSVLPTAGATMVTYNFLALAVRLGDRLKRLVAEPSGGTQ